jgi:outer membrane protein OmpA-like peptidoglycan-associated protein
MYHPHFYFFEMKKIALLVVLASLACAVAAQKTKSDGEAAFADGRWADALDLLSQYQTQKPGDIGVLTKIGHSAYHLHQPEKALKNLEYVTFQAKTTDPDAWFALARTLHGVQEWERAIEAYKQFLRLASADHPLRANVVDNLRRCVTGMTTPSGGQVALIENLGQPINSAGDEFAPLPSPNHPDRLYFAAATPQSIGGLRDDAGYENLRTGHFCSDMLLARYTNRGWEAPRSFSSLQNTARFEYAADFTDGGRVLCFFRGFTLYGGQFLTDTAGLNDEYRSQSATLLSPMLPAEGDGTPFFFDDTTLIFSSRRAGGQGGLDLWAATFSGGAWSAPTNLGPIVNSAYDDTTPFVARDGRTLYWSSNRIESVGGLDVFRSAYDDTKQVWSKPESMGLGINSPGDDAFFRLAADGRSATFSSDRITDNLGQRDVYRAYFKDALAEQNGDAPRAAFLFFKEKKVENEAETIRSVAFEPIFYNSDRDLTNTDNQKIIQQAAIALQQHPDARLLITCHTDDNAPAKFDLFAGIKRAEQVAKLVADRTGSSSDAARMVVRSVGPHFPLATNLQDGGTPNPTGQRLNRRIDLMLSHAPSQQGPLSFRAQRSRPTVPDPLALGGTARLDAQDGGLLYRVEFASTRQVLTSDALALLTDVLIERDAASGTYRYLAGAERQFAKMAAVKREVVAQGFGEATVVAYLDGVRIERAEAVGLLKKYPDLAAFIRG